MPRAFLAFLGERAAFASKSSSAKLLLGVAMVQFRRVLAWCLCAVIFCSLQGCREATGSHGPASAIVARAIQAHGGWEAIERIQKVRSRQKVFMGQQQAIWVDQFDLPDRLRRDCFSEIAGEMRRTRLLTVGGKTWMIRDDGVVTRSPAPIRADGQYPVSFFQDLKWLRDAKCKVCPPQSHKTRQGLVGITTTNQDGIAERFYFDTKTGRLIQTEQDCKSLRGPGMRVEATAYSDFRRVQGLVVPFQQVSDNGTLVVEEFELATDLPEDTFVVPVTTE